MEKPASGPDQERIHVLHKHSVLADEVLDLIDNKLQKNGIAYNDLLEEKVVAFEPYQREGWSVHVSVPKSPAAPADRPLQPRCIVAAEDECGRIAIGVLNKDNEFLDPETAELVAPDELEQLEQAFGIN
ncbi:TPA: hypothetical protein EYO12_04035 [Candidatus Saccharibacteria bacterium]|nr:hypothetical protein [Candidatus Saccharibacteria bacterium]HIO87795.1 hypothetical protein [Candidatus Saccharibacteria bacterium]